MARVFLEFLGVVPAWMGIVVIVVAVTSAILGVLYALMEHDLKRLLAYHSIENIGIILLGMGAAMMFRTAGHPRLAAVAVIACLLHTFNHAVFKCLLFLGAGSVLRSTHSRNMEELGGLNRRMPWTAACFLVGAIAISGLPPLNGFVSEWLTYQSLLAGFGAAKGLVSLMFPIAGSLLALTGALAAACFVKAFGITFLALPRSPEAENAHESPGTMIAGMGILAVSCFGLGIGASWLLPMFDGITGQLVGARVGHDLTLANGFAISSGSPRGGSVSTAVIAAMLLALAAIPAWLFARRFALRRVGPHGIAASQASARRMSTRRLPSPNRCAWCLQLFTNLGGRSRLTSMFLHTSPRPSTSRARLSRLSKTGSTSLSNRWYIGFRRGCGESRQAASTSIWPISS